jgi:NAD(P)-dependent dehydrogenase (short-subunit alcohol dehydrogenase family)
MRQARRWRPSRRPYRWGDAECRKDIAESVAFVASDRAQWITGANFMIDGGASPN